MQTRVGVRMTVVIAIAVARGAATYRLTLNGAHEVPENPHGGRDRGTGSLSIDADTGEICYSFDSLVLTEGEALPFGAHIHAADKGVAGGIIVHLFGTGDAPPAPTSYPTSETCVTTDPATAAAIVADPHGYYVNLHNVQHPTGVVRDQLRG
jgi:hypothetical protein